EVSCAAACACQPDGGAAIDCCVSGGFGSSCSHPFACPTNIAAHLCGDPTTDPAIVQGCDDALGPFTCTNVNGDVGVELPSACQPATSSNAPSGSCSRHAAPEVTSMALTPPRGSKVTTVRPSAETTRSVAGRAREARVRGLAPSAGQRRMAARSSQVSTSRLE